MRPYTKMTSMGSHILSLVLCISSLTACVLGVEIEIKDTSTTPNTFNSPAGSVSETAPMAYLREVRVISDGAETGPSHALMMELKSRLRKSGLFSEVNFEKIPHQDAVSMDLTLTEQRDVHELKNVISAIFAGGSLGILSPFFPGYSDRFCMLEVQTILPNGESKKYSVKTEATMKVNMFSAEQGHRQLYLTTLDKTLNAWLAQMAKDAEFYAAARMPDSDPRSSSFQTAKALNEEKYILHPTVDYSFSPFWMYIPSDLEDAFRELQKMMHPSYVEEFKEVPEQAVPRYHMSLGRWIRTKWGLWKGSRLSEYFNSLGITHSDDMSAIILTSFHRSLKNKPIELDQQIKYYQDYWKQIEMRNHSS